MTDFDQDQWDSAHRDRARRERSADGAIIRSASRPQEGRTATCQRKQQAARAGRGNWNDGNGHYVST
jgi:hypothetical protein